MSDVPSSPEREPFYSGRVPENPWFEIDGPVDAWEFDEAELAFATRLRALAERWDVPFASSWVGRPEDDSSLLAVVTLGTSRLSLADFGVHVTGSTMRGDRLDNPLHFLPERPTSYSIEVTGSPDEHAERAAQWFETILRKPVVRHEWVHDGRIHAELYLFADTGEGMAQRYDSTLSPPGQEQELIAAGQVTGLNWIQTSGLGPPDRIVPVRGTSEGAGSSERRRLSVRGLLGRF
ncbi:hypothetical protein [Streptomyces sp. NPDC021608]|uniref:hypothetical protein n=1 Tax=Streptomyces sp. NPDC021608 TaxID=3154903 RepID=UPI0033F20BB5